MRIRTPQHTQEARQAAEAPVVDLGAQKSAHALPEAFSAQAQAPSLRGLAALLPAASGATAVPSYDQPTVDLGIDAPVRQIDTPEFKAWFGSSKIVDKRGEPLVVYHGAGWGFDRPEFLSARPTDTVHFAADPGLASGHACDRARSELPHYAERGPDGNYPNPLEVNGPNLIPVYLKIENPFDPTKRKHVKALEAKVGCSIQEDLCGDGDDWMVLEEYGNEIQELGYDGVIIEGMADIAVFKGIQIKSAIGNCGAFDPNDPDITK